jgi:hypothetical protein
MKNMAGLRAAVSLVFVEKTSPAHPVGTLTAHFVVKLPPSTPVRHIIKEGAVYNSRLTTTDKLTRHARSWRLVYKRVGTMMGFIPPTPGVPGVIITNWGSAFASHPDDASRPHATDCVATTSGKVKEPTRSMRSKERTN